MSNLMELSHTDLMMNYMSLEESLVLATKTNQALNLQVDSLDTKIEDLERELNFIKTNIGRGL